MVPARARLTIGEPLGTGQTLALRAVPVAARIVGNTSVTARLALLDMAAERGCPAPLDGRHDAALPGGQAAGLIGPIGGAVAAEDVRHLEPGPHGAGLFGSDHHECEPIERAWRASDQVDPRLGVAGRHQACVTQ